MLPDKITDIFDAINEAIGKHRDGGASIDEILSALEIVRLGLEEEAAEETK